ncbi:hypothetical protein CGZ80_02740 [Rhodopirellula sp. MGV]|nr:hypothetical protein CGZ80_02740 [Rhodopirellula sp. MGV]PNY38498.1 hypothetical protein C2E31_00770 [Rhodopirellula baltica]
MFWDRTFIEEDEWQIHCVADPKNKLPAGLRRALRTATWRRLKVECCQAVSNLIGPDRVAPKTVVAGIESKWHRCCEYLGKYRTFEARQLERAFLEFD